MSVVGLIAHAGADALLRSAVRFARNQDHQGCAAGPRPPARAMLRVGGPTPLRALLVGTGPMVGFGVLSHDLALGGHLARRLAALTGFGIDMDVVTEEVLHARDLKTLLGAVVLDRYDMVIMSIGTQDVIDRTPVDEWSKAVGPVLDLLGDRLERALPVSVIAVPKLSKLLHLEPHLAHSVDDRVTELNLRLEELCAARPGSTFVPFPIGGETDSCPERTSASYGRWADVLGEGIIPTLGALRHVGAPNDPETARQAALDRLGILDTAPDEILDTIVHKARHVLGTVGAGVSLIDHDRQWFSNSDGTAIPELPRSQTICHHTIQTNHGLVVEDATSDPRFNDGYFVATAKLRSYAGVPIRDPHGYMIGALCVYDDKPRKFQPADLTMLRYLAHAIEERLLTLGTVR